MKIVGLDPSLTGTGLALLTGDSHSRVSTWHLNTGTMRGHERLGYIRSTVLGAAEDADLVAIEGPAYGSAAGARQSGHHERAGLWWLLTHTLWRAEVPYVVIPPNMRAKYATGRGNAGKDEVLLAVARRYPDVAVADNNEADALVLAAMGARHLDRPLEASLPAAHLLAMGSVTWPELISA